MAEYELLRDRWSGTSIELDAHAAVQNGDSVDTLGYNSLTIVFISGTIGAGTADFVVEHADDNGAGSPGTFSAVDADDLVGTPPTLTTTDDDQIHKVGYRGKKRHVRVRNVETATWTTHQHAVGFILGDYQYIA